MHIRPGIVLSVVLALGIAGCARPDQSDGVATAGGAKVTPSQSVPALSDADRAVRFAQCMREHGVPMEDPQPGEGGVRISIQDGVTKEQADAAMQACRQYLPGGGETRQIDPQAVEQLRKFAQCMREHGVPNFPDPQDGGGLRIDGNTLGVDPRSPTFEAAQRACQQYQPTPPSGGPGMGTQEHSENGA